MTDDELTPDPTTNTHDSATDSDTGSESDSAFGSNVRTNERTDGEGGDGRLSGNGGERARADDDTDIALLGDIISSGFMRTWERHEVVRTGEREPIPSHVRAAVWYRDHGKCAMCPGIEYQPEGPLHLDHIVPWSAGGSDTTENLRLLCEPHNLERSNFIDHAGPKLPATWWCHRCYGEQHHWEYYENGTVVCPVHKRWGPDGQQCRVARSYMRAHLSGQEPDWWHMREPLRWFDVVAYCAHCNSPGETSVIL